MPKITHINKENVDTAGGEKITIKGYGFAGETAPVVTIGDVPCDVDLGKIKNDKIECTTRVGTTTPTGLHVGAGGIIKRLYHNDGAS